MVPALLLLLLVVSLLAARVQEGVRRGIRTPGAVLLCAAALACFFCAAAAWHGVLTIPLALLVFAYVTGPAVCVLASGKKRGAGLPDLAGILLLWLPLELGLGGDLVPRPVQGALHATAYGVAITLALILFVVYRQMEGMKYNVPQRVSDFGAAAAGFACAAAILIPAGMAVGFIGAAHAPAAGAGRILTRFAAIFAGTALPEEILFRSLLQNWFEQRLGSKWGAVGAGAVVFGLAHLNNGPGALPNWPYAVVGLLAGLIFGTVFVRSTSVLAPALVHACVNTVKYLFF